MDYSDLGLTDLAAIVEDRRNVYSDAKHDAEDAHASLIEAERALAQRVARSPTPTRTSGPAADKTAVLSMLVDAGTIGISPKVIAHTLGVAPVKVRSALLSLKRAQQGEALARGCWRATDAGRRAIR